MVVDKHFQDPTLLSKPLILSLAAGNCFPWSDRIHSLLRKYLPNSQVWLTTVCHSFQVTEDVSRREQRAQLTTQTSSSVFSLENALLSCFLVQQACVTLTSHLRTLLTWSCSCLSFVGFSCVAMKTVTSVVWYGCSAFTHKCLLWKCFWFHGPLDRSWGSLGLYWEHFENSSL